MAQAGTGNDGTRRLPMAGAAGPALRSAPAPDDYVPSPTGGKKHIELTPIHDFAGKLRHPELLPRLKEYVRWQARRRGILDSLDAVEEAAESVPPYAPVSINLDITTACNYQCDHCVDKEILNKPIKYAQDRLLASLELMAKRGLKSVIVIGGGEPTVYRHFTETVRFMKELGLQVAVVSNGSRLHKIAEVAEVFDENDWVRLSLDAGSNDTFVRMHKPRKAITLDAICEGVRPIKEINDRFPIGFSFIITWKGATIHDASIVENIHEIEMAAERAKRYGFDYIAYKPFLTRAERNNAEVVDLKESDDHFDRVIAIIRERVDRAKQLADERFRVYETPNLKVLENRSFRDYTQQPHTCHMQFFRQVLSPLGLYNCPVYRNQPHGYLGTKDAYVDGEAFERTRAQTAKLISHFDATEECKEVTCLYNHVNHWIEALVRNPALLDEIEPIERGAPDFFL